MSPFDFQQDNTDGTAPLAPTVDPNIITIPVPAAAVLQEPRPPLPKVAAGPPQPSPTPPPLPSPLMDDLSPSPPSTPTPRMSSLHPSENASEDLSSLLDLDMTMENVSPPSPAPTMEVIDSQNASRAQPHRPIAISRSEGNIFETRPLPTQSSIRARIQEDAAMRLLDTNTSSRNPRSKYTIATMPAVHDASLTSIYDHVQDSMLKEWERSPGEKVLVQPFDEFVTNALNHEFLRLRILSAVTDITQANHVRVSAPLLLKNTDEAPPKQLTPTAFLVCNLAPSHVKTLLDRYVWTSTSIAFRVIPSDPPRPNYLFTIRGLGTTLIADVRDIVQTVWHDEDTIAFLTLIANEAPLADRRNVASSLQTFIDSLDIERLDIKECGDTLAPRYNILANGSTIMNDNTWSRICSFLANRAYVDFLIGIGTIEVSPYKCTLCHSVTHPRGLCPFPDIKGWNAPIYQTPNRAERGRGLGPRV